MKITEIRIRPSDEDGTLAKADITLEHSLVIRGMSIHACKDGHLAVNFPSRTREDGARTDIIFPVVAFVRREIEARILKDYKHMQTFVTNQN